jgi:hypothetical protein
MSERRRDIEHASAPSPTPYNMTMCGLTWEDVLGDGGIHFTKVSGWTDCRECQQVLGLVATP